ncbi:MAG: hypothetical protein Q8878_05890 [Bacillota bacterium]|nr:hypothetical protein [Bacillota bacterium]
MDIFADRIEPLLRSSGVSDSEFERSLNLPRSIVYDWRNKRSRSYMKYLPEIAGSFGVTVGFLLSDDNSDNFFSAPQPKYDCGRISEDLMKKIDESKKELEEGKKARKQHLLDVIKNTDFSISQLYMIEHILEYIKK